MKRIDLTLEKKQTNMKLTLNRLHRASRPERES